ncbi:hypothetical protein PUN28_008551 [Cardiocondyla obscurior]|uniref:Uncharacterized protein n=1 Tax=Cardiocondyla obscurior TaxID=286306 RepID=A0AAW2FY63_9HYME
MQIRRSYNAGMRMILIDDPARTICQLFTDTPSSSDCRYRITALNFRVLTSASLNYPYSSVYTRTARTCRERHACTDSLAPRRNCILAARLSTRYSAVYPFYFFSIIRCSCLRGEITVSKPRGNRLNADSKSVTVPGIFVALFKPHRVQSSRSSSVVFYVSLIL